MDGTGGMWVGLGGTLGPALMLSLRDTARRQLVRLLPASTCFPVGDRGAAEKNRMTASSELVSAAVFYMICSAGMSVFNKLAVRAMPLPITLVLVQMSFTLMSITAQRKAIHIGSLRDALRWGLTIPILFAAMLVSSMVAMEHNTLGTIVVFRNVAPLFTLFIERMFRVPMAVSCETVLALLSIVVGVALYHLHTLGLTTMGLIAVCLNMVSQRSSDPAPRNEPEP
jgi:hypothetical protein